MMKKFFLVLAVLSSSIAFAEYGGAGSTASLATTSTNDNAAAGRLGEYISSSVSSLTSVPGATTVWADTGCVLNTAVTPGDWDIRAAYKLNLNAATMTAFSVALSQFSGATTTDQTVGDNQLDYTNAVSFSGVVGEWRVSTASTLTIRLKLNVTYSAGTPQYVCRISARRVR